MNEADLVKIRTALEQEPIEKAFRAMEKVLLELGYYQATPMPQSSEKGKE